MKNEEYMDEINCRILRVTEDLRAIQQELNCAAMQAPGDPELMEILSGISETESLQVLRSAVDQMRHFLWFYAQVLTEDSTVGEHLRESLRQGQPSCEPRVSTKTTWPSDTTLIRMLAEGRHNKPN
jgi:hypothetical protein